VASNHVPYFLAAEVMALAWNQLLLELGPGLISARDVAVVHVDFDFSRELFVGAATFDVEVLRVGTTSITFGLRVEQYGKLAATGTTVVARTDEARLHALPLTPQQRTALDRCVVV
jgi:acyl-CoA thioesterase FadM